MSGQRAWEAAAEEVRGWLQNEALPRWLMYKDCRSTVIGLQAGASSAWPPAIVVRLLLLFFLFATAAESSFLLLCRLWCGSSAIWCPDRRSAVRRQR